MINPIELKKAMQDAVRFVDCAAEYLNALEKDKERVKAELKKNPIADTWNSSFPAESGMVRNTSLVLWRQLARMRRAQR